MRQLFSTDAEAVLRILADPAVVRHMQYMTALSSTQEADELIRWSAHLYASGTGILWGLAERETGKLIGTLDYTHIPEDDRSVHRSALTVCLAPNRWGEGLASEAIRRSLPYVFERVGIERVEARIHKENTRALRLLARVGFRVEGVLREYARFQGVLSDVMAHALLRREWNDRTNPAERFALASAK